MSLANNYGTKRKGWGPDTEAIHCRTLVHFSIRIQGALFVIFNITLLKTYWDQNLYRKEEEKSLEVFMNSLIKSPLVHLLTQ